jgi:transposase-like protein
VIRKQNNPTDDSSKVVFQELDSWIRVKIQDFIQQILEEEVTDLLGRSKGQRQQKVDSMTGYRNGYGKPRKLTTSCGTIRLRRPRVRNTSDRFESRILPLFERRTKQVSELIPELYLHGLSQGDFDLALRGLLGDDAPLSPATVARLKARWQLEYEQWKNESLEGLEVVYLWVDGVYVRAGLEQQKACLLVAIAGLSDGRKIFVAIEAGYRESIQSWGALLRDLKKRGMSEPRLVIGDGHLGIWGALREIYPQSHEQRCWNHRIVNIIDRVPKKKQGEGRELLKQIPYAESRREAEVRKQKFQKWCERNQCSQAAELIAKEWERMVAFYDYPREHWKHLRTTNVIESVFSSVRLRTDASRRYKKVENATAVIWKIMMVGEKKFRRLDAPELLKEVYEGAIYKDGIRVRNEMGKEAA